MRVAEVTAFGGPEVLVTRDVPDPVAGPGQVVIGVSVVDTIFLDTQLRSGWGGEYFTMTPPYVPGGGVAGQVVAAGEGVDPDWVGRRVVTSIGERGGYAERAVAPADGLVPVPDGLGLRDAAALVHDGPAALCLAETARIQPGEWVLVAPAAGGLGILLVQLAASAGARVVAAARGEHKLDLARKLGAEVTVDYTEAGWPERVRAATGGTGPAVVFDGVGGENGRAAFGLTARGGRFHAYGAPSGALTQADPDEARRREVTVVGLFDLRFDRRPLTERALAEASAGRIQPVIGRTFPLDRAADAHAAMEARTVLGKTLLLTGG
ncbi:zinc-binding dehydrogenase [Actinomadura scrupuli]|uniref:zinc-binding dehydrogenase n=1 Tax=Actinomadura scrupuli TaxID=559629 RepID=UPI003D99DC61